MVIFKGVSFCYNNSLDVLHTTDLNIKSGEFVVLTGASGSGKTTLTRIINGLVPHFYDGQFSGQVYISDYDANKLAMWERAKLVGSIFQDPRSQFFSNQIEGEIAFGCENLGYPNKKIVEQVKKAIEVLEIKHLQGKNVRSLSNGEKQKVAIASVWAMEPSIFVFDEPSSNLDTESIIILAAIMEKLKKNGHTLIVAEHRLHYLANLADYYIYLETGRIKSIFTGAEMKSKRKEELDCLGLRCTNPSKQLPEGTINHNTIKCLSNEGVIEVKNISYAYKGKNVLNNLSFSVPAGEITAITGPNGAGKTTLVKILCGLYKEKSGLVLLNGHRIRWRERLKRFYMVMHDTDSQLFCNSVEEEIMLNINKTNENIDKAICTLKQFGLYKYKNRHPSTLSGGQKQRLVLATAIMNQADVIILDEPTSGLDLRSMKRVAAALKQLALSGKIIVVVTHDYELIHECCSKVINLCIESGNE